MYFIWKTRFGFRKGCETNCRNGNKREGGNSINITIEEQEVEQVNQFNYLGLLI